MIVEQAAERYSFLLSMFEDDPTDPALAGRLIEAEHNLANVRHAHAVMEAELADMSARFATHQCDVRCGGGDHIDLTEKADA